MDNKDKTKLQVSAIKNGTVIDHIPADCLFDVISILNIDKIESLMTFGTNFESHRLGKKAIIKIEEMFFPEEAINKIALVAPEAKLNIIRDYRVVEKKDVVVPDEITGIAKCVNPQCVTNHEKIITRFDVVAKKEVMLRCRYCEKTTDRKRLQII